MDKELIKKVIWSTVLYGLTVGALYYVLRVREMSLTNSQSVTFSSFSLSFIFAPLVATLALNYAASLLSVLVQGRVVPPVCLALRLMAVPTGLMLLSSWSGIPMVLLPIIQFLFYVLLTYSIHHVALVVGQKYEKILTPVLLCAAVLVYMTLTRQALTGIAPSLQPLIPLVDLGRVDGVFLVAFLVTAVTALFGLLKEHRNQYASFIGREIGSGTFTKFFLFIFLSFYLQLGRSYLTPYINPQYLVIVEWVAVCLTAYSFYRLFKNYVNTALVKYIEVEEWKAHVQKIEWTTDARLDDLTNHIKEFHATGRKENLLVNLISVLLEVGGNESDIARVTAPLINHRDVEPGVVILRWQVSYLEKENKKRRQAVLQDVLAQLESLDYMPLVEPPSPPDANIEVGSVEV